MVVQCSETLHYCCGLPCVRYTLANLGPGSVPHHRWMLLPFDSGWLHAQAAQKCMQDFRHGLKNPFLSSPSVIRPQLWC